MSQAPQHPQAAMPVCGQPQAALAAARQLQGALEWSGHVFTPHRTPSIVHKTEHMGRGGQTHTESSDTDASILTKMKA